MTNAIIPRRQMAVPGLNEIPGDALTEFPLNLIAGSPGIGIARRLDDCEGLPGERPAQRGETGDTANGTRNE